MPTRMVLRSLSVAISLVFAAPLLATGFDAATLRRVDQAAGRLPGMNHRVSPTRLTFSAASLGYCLTWAYDLPFYRIAAPSWVTSLQAIRYDITATVDRPVSEAEMKEMLRQLLAERLGLVVHREQRELAVYGLIVGKGGSKLRPSESGAADEIKATGPYIYHASNASIAMLIRMLEPPFTSRPVLDMTGLNGGFDFTVDLSRYLTDPLTGNPAVTLSGQLDWEGALLAALPRQLGLELRPEHALVEMLVVDTVNKEPTIE